MGKGNGIPDIIDEAEWGGMFWEYMQESTGEIHWGTETQGYSPFTTYDQETKRFGTEVLDKRSGGFCGRDVHAPRPPDQALQAGAFGEQLQKHAEMAMAAAGPRCGRRTASIMRCRSTC